MQYEYVYFDHVIYCTSQFFFLSPTQDSTGNRVLDGDDDDPEYGSEDGDKAKTFQDVDGSVTGVANSQIVKPYDYYVTDQCMKKINWDMAICPHDYGKVRMKTSNESNVLNIK